MSANNARRHQTGRTEAGPGRLRTQKVLGLLALRDRLALAAAEYEAHDFAGATDVFQQQLDIEAAIRTHAPDVYQARWTQWLESDTQLAHTPQTPHPKCGYCQLLANRAHNPTRPPTFAAS